MGGKRLDIEPGDRYGRLVIIQEVNQLLSRRFCLCKCDCGNQKVIGLGDLSKGHTKSCGCLRKINHRKTHGKSIRTNGRAPRLYEIWRGMRQRCLNENHPSWHNYGGRGISICKEWDDYEVFHNWAISNGYRDDLTIERIDNDGNYEPDNCKWIPRNKQPMNSRHNRMIAYNGQTKYLAQWAREQGFNYGTLLFRLNGWTIEKALTTPVRATGR